MKTSRLACLVASVMLLPAASWAGGGRSVEPFDPGLKVFGKTYSEWAEAWTDWAYSYPFATSPILDEDGSYCAQGQKGKVWFLAGSFFNEVPYPYERHCTIPPGKALFFPIVNTLTFKPEFPDPESGNAHCLGYETDIEQTRCDIYTDLLKYGPDPDAETLPVLRVEVNGTAIADPFGYRVESAPGGYTFQLLKGSILEEVGYTPGPRPSAIAGGYWVMLPPLGPRENQVHIYAKNTSGEVLDVTYHITTRGSQ